MRRMALFVRHCWAPARATPSIAEMVSETRRTYQGPLVAGDDLMPLDIGANVIAV
jgi:hypothetical protein